VVTVVISQTANKSESVFYSPNNGIDLKVLMATTPQSHPPIAPHPALPYLQGYLREVLPNAQTKIKDFNAIFYAYHLSEEQLQKRFSPEEATIIRGSYEAQRNEQEYSDVPSFIAHHKTLEDALSEISEQHQKLHGLEKESLHLRGNTFTYISEYSGNNREGILDAILPEAREGNFFFDFYNNVVVPHIAENNYDVVALSVHLPDQLIPTFLLASMIKEKSPETKVVIGGNYVTRIRETFSQDDDLNRRLFDYVDAVIPYEGELPFRQVLEKIADSRGNSTPDFSGVNQVVYREEGKIVSNFDRTLLPAVDMNRLPRPDFDGIFTDLKDEEYVFWTPTPVITLYTERGCKWANVCDFCTIPFGNNIATSFGVRSTRLVADDMRFYQEKYGSTAFSFGNETLSREFMLGLTEELDRLGIEAKIDGYTRTDQFRVRDGSVDLDLVQKISKYFRFLQIGVESSDEETLESMNKRRSPQSDSALVEALFENGIYPHTFLLIGFPPDKSYQGKTKEEFMEYYVRSAVKTLQWLEANKDHIGTFKVTPLYVPRDDPKMVSQPNGDFVIHPNYAHEIELGEPRDLEANVPYEKLHGSTKLDRLFVRLFDEIVSPYREYTRNTIYQQRLFNWHEGVQWSQETVQRESRTLNQIWNEIVGKDYREALEELKKKGGISQEKRRRLESLIGDIRSRNKFLQLFPEGIESIDQLLQLDFTTI